MGETVASAAFVQELRQALLHLYDAPKLRRSPLVGLLGVSQREDPPTSLRHLLLAAIGSLKPGPEVPPQAGAWRTYQILSLRYAEQVSQREVSSELCLSIRQLRRQESLALRTLADLLWNRHNLADQAPEPESTALPLDPSEDGTPSREEEMEWLRRSFPSKGLANSSELLDAVLRTAAPLAQGSHVRLEARVPTDLPSLAAQPTAIRQALLNALIAAIHCAPGGQVQIEAAGNQRDSTLHVRITPCPQANAACPLSAKDHESLEMAGQLATLAGGSLALTEGDGDAQAFSAAFTLPAVEQVNVLFVDDNADTLNLVQRYLAGTRYRAITVRDPRQALTVTEEVAPDLIVLDVMLPGVDGWELLGRLREHPRTRHVPIIACTILPHEDLALALGAAAFLRKPVSRKTLLAALDEIQRH